VDEARDGVLAQTSVMLFLQVRWRQSDLRCDVDLRGFEAAVDAHDPLGQGGGLVLLPEAWVSMAA